MEEKLDLPIRMTGMQSVKPLYASPRQYGDRIKDEFGVDAKLIKGDNGVFDVKADGKLIFSKHESGRFPTHEEILEKLR